MYRGLVSATHSTTSYGAPATPALCLKFNIWTISLYTVLYKYYVWDGCTKKIKNILCLISLRGLLYTVLYKYCVWDVVPRRYRINCLFWNQYMGLVSTSHSTESYGAPATPAPCLKFKIWTISWYTVLYKYYVWDFKLRIVFRIRMFVLHNMFCMGWLNQED